MTNGCGPALTANAGPFSCYVPVILPPIHPASTCYPAISSSHPGQTGIPFHQSRRFRRPSSRLFPGNRANHFPRTIRSACFRHRQNSTIRRQSASSIQSAGFRPHRYSSSMPHSCASQKYRKLPLPRKLPGPQPEPVSGYFPHLLHRDTLHWDADVPDDLCSGNDSFPARWHSCYPGVLRWHLFCLNGPRPPFPMGPVPSFRRLRPEELRS